MTDNKQPIDPKSQSASDLPYHNAETAKIAADRSKELQADEKAAKVDSLKAELAALEGNGEAQ